MYRHGDVNLFQVSKEQKELIKSKGKIVYEGNSYIMARGEATNSTHDLTVPAGVIVREYEGKTYYETLGVGTATHTHDHEPITIEPDFYVQVPEREVDNWSHCVKIVQD